MSNKVNIDQSLIARTGRYIIITAMRNEIKTIEKSINSVLLQTVLPKIWIILDDGSNDGSSDIVTKYTEAHDWIIRVPIADRGFDFVGQGVADLLNYGFDITKDIDVEYIAKLDADIDLPTHYFATLLDEMDANPLLGIVSGHPYVINNDKIMLERHSDYFPSGTARLYRNSYLKLITPFVSSVGWDTVDILRMQILGYDTKVLHDIQLHHMRRMGTRRGYFDGMIRDGRNNYITGYSPLFFFLRSVYNARYYPFVLRTLCMLYGYSQAYINKLPRAVTEEEHFFHLNLQKNRIKNYYQSILKSL
jgi:glycosyltransferase involved in cell wall biosynthesis